MEEEQERDYPHGARKPISKPMQEEEGGGGDGDYTYKKKNYTNQPTHHEEEEEEEEEEEDNSNRKSRKSAYSGMQRKGEYEKEEDYSTEKATHTKGTSSSSDMLSSAKYLAEATQHAFRHETDMIDRSRAAGAAEDLLQAASRYGKLEEKGLGQYIDKAESYLHQYHSSSSPAQGGHGEGDQTSQPSHDSAGGGGHGDYLKMAQGFLKKY